VKKTSPLNPILITNEENLGFVKSCNKAFELAVAAKRDIILLNSDCLLAPGAITEIVNVAKLDEKVAFVSPRSNNATIASLPYEAQFKTAGIDEALYDFRKFSDLLERYTYSPTAVGFCCLVKWQILADFGFFDEIYASGYQEENDLVMRANKSGYRSVLANHAFVWHEGKQSFGLSESTPDARDAKNAQILKSRYPEFQSLVRRFETSAERQAENLIVSLRKDDVPLVVFDFSNIGSYFNGTFEAAIKIARSCVENWKDKYKFGFLMDLPAWKFHGLDEWREVRRYPAGSSQIPAAAIVRVGQPFDINAVERNFNRAAVNVFYMLDTIAFDCGYSSISFNHMAWQATLKFADVVFANSKFTEKQYRARFSVGSNTTFTHSYHSLDLRDYVPRVAPTVEASIQNYVFVVGNAFPHKFVNETMSSIEKNTTHNVVCLGKDNDRPTLRSKTIESGKLSERQMETLWSEASCVVFPSHYEGFGFPIPHALARKKVVFARDTELNRELASLVPCSDNIYLFQTTDELIQLLNAGIPEWIESSTALNSGFVHSWRNAADELMEQVETRISQVNFKFLVERISFVREMSNRALIESHRTPAARVGYTVERLIEAALRIPGVKALIKPMYGILVRYLWR
jgi:hypothetical protein